MVTTGMPTETRRGWNPEEDLEELDSRTRPPRILLAEDDPEMRRLAARALRSDGYEVVEAKNGLDLLEHVSPSLATVGGSEADLIVSDIRMPGFSGLEILAELRRADDFTPALLITAFGDPEIHTAAARLGAYTLDKPFELAMLRGLVRWILRVR